MFTKTETATIIEFVGPCQSWVTKIRKGYRYFVSFKGHEGLPFTLALRVIPEKEGATPIVETLGPQDALDFEYWPTIDGELQMVYTSSSTVPQKMRWATRQMS